MATVDKPDGTCGRTLEGPTSLVCHYKQGSCHAQVARDAGRPVELDLVDVAFHARGCDRVNAGKVVATFMLGSERLYRWVDDNPMVEMRSADYTNDTSVIRRFKRMIAINSTIEIDLTGQVCADSIGSRM